MALTPKGDKTKLVSHFGESKKNVEEKKKRKKRRKLWKLRIYMEMYGNLDFVWKLGICMEMYGFLGFCLVWKCFYGY